MWTLLIGFLTHAIFLYSIFDIYFTSPIVHGMTPQKPLKKWDPPAKRVVLFVADGLRADYFFTEDEHGHQRAPFLNKVAEERGKWGISHTRMPTESRPGHVAIIAGLYEDPSAVTKGWRVNPVTFDSVFNESRHVFAWGSPDIIPMFVNEIDPSRVCMETYSAEEEDFFTKNSSAARLDWWVFSHLTMTLRNASSGNARLWEQLHQPHIVFFLHLLGLDTNGHAHKPASKEYIQNIKVADEIARLTEEVIETFFEHDGQTAYVFTADHGMTDWGSHGAGSTSETETPLVAWGAGICCDNSRNVNWNENYKMRRSDVKQADIAVLMAAVLGIPIPMNSVGSLPLHYLQMNDSQKADILFTNARQMSEQFKRKHDIVEDNTMKMLFQPFPDLSVLEIEAFQNKIDVLISKGRYNDSMAFSHLLFNKSHNGIEYYHRYHQQFLMIAITLGFLGRICNLASVSIDNYSFSTRKHFHHTGNYAKCVNVTFGTLGLLLTLLLLCQNSPFLYYFYCLLPLGLWWNVLHNPRGLWKAVLFVTADRKNCFKALFIGAVYIVGVKIIVAGFFERSIFAYGLGGIAIWPLFVVSFSYIWNNNALKCLIVSLVVSCILVGSFTLSPVIGAVARPNVVFWVGSGAIVLTLWLIKQPVMDLVHCYQNQNPRYVLQESARVVIVFVVQIAIAVISVFVTQKVSISLTKSTDGIENNSNGIWIGYHITSWIALILSLVLPIFGSSRIQFRLLHIALGIFSPVLLLSPSGFELTFYICLLVLLATWIGLEYNLTQEPELKLADIRFTTKHVRVTEPVSSLPEDLRRAYFFLFFILVSFFGTGNIASLNSFDPSTVMCFVTVFSPFVMGFLLLLKVMFPFLAVTCALRAVAVSLNISVRHVFLLVLILSDIAVLHFFYLVTNRGSWLDIGTSISHYVIMELAVLIICLMYGIASILTAGDIQSFSVNVWPLLLDFLFPNRISGSFCDIENTGMFDSSSLDFHKSE